MPQQITGMILITVHPDMVAPAALSNVEVAVAVGKGADTTLAGFARAISETPPPAPVADLPSGSMMVWLRGEGQRPFVAKVEPSKIERRRHLRKYAEGQLPPDRSFYFRGPQNKLNLRAQNLEFFTTMLDGVDDETWIFHLRHRDYSHWFREAIKDEGLAEEVRAIEDDPEVDAAESRSQIKAAIAKRYTAAA